MNNPQKNIHSVMEVKGKSARPDWFKVISILSGAAKQTPKNKMWVSSNSGITSKHVLLLDLIYSERSMSFQRPDSKIKWIFKQRIFIKELQNIKNTQSNQNIDSYSLNGSQKLQWGRKEGWL